MGATVLPRPWLLARRTSSRPGLRSGLLLIAAGLLLLALRERELRSAPRAAEPTAPAAASSPR